MIIMKKTLIVIQIFIFALGCSEKQQGVSLTSLYVEPMIFIDTLVNIEKIEFTGTVQLFGKGFFQIEGNSILFLDRLGMKVLEFDNNGKFQKTILENGEGPAEIPKFQSYTSDGEFRYFLDGYTLMVYDKNNELVSRSVLNFHHQSSLKEIEGNPNPDDAGIYEVKYWENQLEVIDGYLYTKIESSNPKFNFVMNSEYYRNSYLYAKVDPKSGKVLSLFGKHPPVYQRYNQLPHFDYYYHDRHEDQIYISFEPDSLIYVLDQDFEAKESFGNSGKGMDQSYREVSTVEDWEDYWRINRAQKGFYKHIKFFSEEDLLFRTYTLGNPDILAYEYGDNPQRMQIYKGKQLVGDVSVPNFFKIIGKIGDFYYADGSAENPDNEELILYRFKLDVL